MKQLNAMGIYYLMKIFDKQSIFTCNEHQSNRKTVNEQEN